MGVAMKFLKNESGSIIVFFTIMVVLLLVMVGLGLDSGWLAYTRSQGQPAVDAAALAGASAVPTGSATEIQNRIEALNAKNDYVGWDPTKPGKTIDGQVNGSHVTLIKYEFATGKITKVGTVGEANGVRVALENNNPYGAGSKAPQPINTPVFLTPLLNLFGAGVQGTADVSVSAVAVVNAIPTFPVVITGCPGYTVPIIDDPWCSKNPVTGEPPLCTSCSPITGGGMKGTDCSLIRNPNPTDSAGWTNLQINPPVSTSVVRSLLKTTQTCENAQAGAMPGTSICLNNGNIPVLVAEIDNLFGPFTSPPTEPDDCFIIPVVDQTISNITQCKPVEQFARICISKVICPQCSNKPPQGGVYQQQIIVNIECPYDPSSLTLGCFTEKLVRDPLSGM